MEEVARTVIRYPDMMPPINDTFTKIDRGDGKEEMHTEITIFSMEGQKIMSLYHNTQDEPHYYRIENVRRDKIMERNGYRIFEIVTVSGNEETTMDKLRHYAIFDKDDNLVRMEIESGFIFNKFTFTLYK
jgi:hypothetical protein